MLRADGWQEPGRGCDHRAGGRNSGPPGGRWGRWRRDAQRGSWGAGEEAGQAEGRGRQTRLLTQGRRGSGKAGREEAYPDQPGHPGLEEGQGGRSSHPEGGCGGAGNPEGSSCGEERGPQALSEAAGGAGKGSGEAGGTYRGPRARRRWGSPPAGPGRGSPGRPGGPGRSRTGQQSRPWLPGAPPGPSLLLCRRPHNGCPTGDQRPEPRRRRETEAAAVKLGAAGEHGACAAGPGREGPVSRHQPLTPGAA